MSSLPNLPRGWAWATVREVGEVKLGRQRSPEHHDGPNMRPYLRVANVYDARLDLSDVLQMNFTPSEFETFQLLPGDVLINEGQSLEWVGRSAIYRGEVPGACFQNTLIRFRAKPLILPEFALLVFRHYVFSQRFRRIAKWTTNIAHLGAERFAEVEFPVPPMNEQRRIVAEADKQLTRLDAGVEALRRVQAQLKRYWASVLKAACEGRLVPTEAELARRKKRDYEPADKLLARILKERRARWEADQLAKMKAAGKPPKDDKWKAKYVEPAVPDTSALPPLPSGWVWATVEQLAADEPNSITDGPFGSNLKSEHYVEAGPRVVRLQNIGEGRFLDAHAHISRDHFDRLKKHRVYPGDLVIAALSERPPRACSIPESLGDAIVKADCVRFKPDAALAQSRYLLATLNSETTRALLSDKVHGVGRPRLNLGEIRSIAIPLPPQQEQLRIIEEVEDQFSIIDASETSVQAGLVRAAHLRQAILRLAFEGALVPQSPKDEPASKLLERLSAAVESKPIPKQGRAKQATAVPKMKKATR